MASAQTVWYKSQIKIGATAIPCYPNARLTCPMNWAIPAIIGNYWQYSYGVGLRQPAVDVTFAVRDKTGEALSSTLLGMFFTRSADGAHDTTAVSGGIQFWNGRSGFTLGGAKAESFTMGCSKGDEIRFSARFVGTSITPLGAAPGVTAWDSSRILRFKAVNFGGSLANIVWSFNLSFSNNHTPDLSLNGSEFPADQNAGMQTAGFVISAQESDSATIEALDSSGPFSQTIVITGTGGNLTLTLNGLLNQTPNERDVRVPRIMRDYSFACLGGSGQTTPPITFASTM